MKVKRIAILGFCGLVSALLSCPNVIAAEKQSQGMISFEVDNTVTPPVNPENPEKPVVPVDPTNPEEPGEGTAGPLSIDYASSFNFGTQKISVKDEIYTAELQSFTDGSTGPNFVQMTDKRGTASGWELSVMQTAQFQADGNELKGAALSLGDFGVNSTIGEEYAPSWIAADQILTPEVKAPILRANDNQGMGTWVLYFGKKETDNAINGEKSVALFVPASAVKLKDMDYRTTLNWELTDAPTK